MGNRFEGLGDFLDRQNQEAEVHRQVETEAQAPPETSVWDDVSSFANTVSERVGAAVEAIPAVFDDIATAYNDLGAKREAFLHQGAELQEAALQGQESGDYSALNEKVQKLQVTGHEANGAMINLMASPVRQAARSFINSNVDDNTSPYQSAAEWLQQTDIGVEYFTTDAEKIQKSREMSQSLSIPAEAIISSPEAYKQALEAYTLKKHHDNIEYVWEDYPELKEIANMDPEAAAIALHDMYTVRHSHNAIDIFNSYFAKASKQYELDTINYKIIKGEATEEDRRRADALREEISHTREIKTNGLFEKAVAGVAESAPEMGASIVEGAETGAAVTMAAVALTVLTGGTDLLAAGVIAGGRAAIMRVLASETAKKFIKAGVMYGAAHGIAVPESGRRYDEVRNEKKADGVTPLYTDEEAKNISLVGGYANAAIEVLNLSPTMKALFPATTKIFKSEVETVIKQGMAKESVAAFAKARMTDWLKLTASESAEEAAQSVADDIITNVARNSKGAEADHLKRYTAQEMAERAGGAFVESLPTSALFGFAGAGIGTITGAGRMARTRKRVADMEAEYGKNHQQTMLGVMAVEQLKNVVKNGNLNKVAPDVQKKVLKEQLANTEFANAYIDVEMAMQKENGREDLQKIAEAQGMSAEDLETAISVNGYIPIGTETLCQIETSSDILEAVSFSEDADSMARMKSNADKILAEYEETAKVALERQIKLVDTIVDNYVPNASDEQRAILRDIIASNPQNPAQGWNEVYKVVDDMLQEKIAPALKALKDGMGKAGNMYVKDEIGNDQLKHYSENDAWYRNFYKQFKRQPTKAELEDMAIAMVTGDPSAPQVQGWIPDSAEAQEALEAERESLESLRNQRDVLQSVKAEAKKLTGVEMELTEGLSPEGYKVYRALTSWTEKAGGKIARAGRMSALLTARHADIVAAIVREKTGRQNYTAEDYVKERIQLQLAKDGTVGGGLNQRAWHGSPYDFAKFDLGAIGSGEGAQVHGWGLYFAGNREVSEGYRERLALDSNEVIIDGETYFYNQEGDFEKRGTGEVIEYGTPLRMAVGYFSTSEGKVKDAIESLQKDIKEATPKKLERWGETWNKAIDILEKEGGNWEYKGAKGGKLFQVEIPDEDVMLDEQKTFSQQPEMVKKAILNILGEKDITKEFAKYGAEAEKVAEKIIDTNIPYEDTYELFNQLSDMQIDDKLIDRLDGLRANLDKYATGELFYRYLSMREGGPKYASELLNQNGIKGITYEGGQDGRCFVVFDDQAIDVIEKYNQQANEDFRVLGGITPQIDGHYLITMMETANESTFMHEMAHMFLFDLEDLAKIDDVSAKELEIVNAWAQWHKGAAAEYKGTAWEKEFAKLEDEILEAEAYGDYDRLEQKKYQWTQERFARGFELYLKEGEAPARGLRAVFRKFKSFLRAIYERFKSDGGKPSEAVRRVMDRMIASEEEIEAAALDDRYSDVMKAGGAKLFSEKEVETLSRWVAEERESAIEKVTKEVMKDLEAGKKAEFDRKIAEERERIQQETEQEPVHLARRALAETNDPEIVRVWFDSEEAFKEADKTAPSVQEVVDAHMEEFSLKLDQELIESHLSKEEIDKALQSSEYRQKIETYVMRGMERKKGLINKINTKARRAMQSIEDKLTALPEDIDMQMEQHEPAVKDIMAEITKLRFAGKWNTADIRHIESMLKASTQAEVRKALKEFKAKVEKKDMDAVSLKEATAGMEKYYRDLAKQVTENQPMTQTCNVQYYLGKEREAGRRVKAMAKADNWEMAIQQQRQKVFYSMMVREARKNREERDKLLKDLQRKAGARTVRLPKDERYWFNHLLYLMNITKQDIKVPEGGVKKLGEMFQENKDNLDCLSPMGRLEEIAAKKEGEFTYETFSLYEFKDVYDDLIRLYTIGAGKFNLKTFAGEFIEDVVRGIITDKSIADNISTVVRKITPDTGGLNYIDSIGNLGKTGDNVAKSIQQYNTSTLKPESIIRMLGDKAFKYIYRTLEKAAEKEAMLQEANLRTIQDICSMFTHSEREDWSKEKYEFAGAKGHKLSKEVIISMALNWGTEQNRQRLLGGLIEDDKLKNIQNEEEAKKAVIDLFERTMTLKEWQFVQRLLDHVGSYWKETAAVEETLNGVAMLKVAPSPINIKTADGQEFSGKGGYMHIKYDPDKSARAEENEADEIADSIRAGAARMGVGRSMVKERSKYNIYRPLKLDYSVLEKHLSDVIHNIAFRVPLRDVYRLLHYRNNKEMLSLEDYIRNTLGVEAYRVIDTWALDAWTQIKDNSNSADAISSKIFRTLRSGSVMNIMGMNVWAALENISNLPIGMDKLGPVKMMTALVDFYSSPIENLGKVRQLSAFMRGRIDNLDRDIRVQPGTLHADNRLFEFAREHAYDLMVYSDLMCSAPIWWKAYKDAYLPKIEEVKKENDENIQKRLKLADEVDKIKAQIAAAHLEAAAIDEFMRVSRYGTPAEIEALRESPYRGKSTGELQAMWGEHKKSAKALGRDLWKAETELEQAMKLPVYDEAEILDEAEKRAVYEADGAIRDTFGSGRRIDQPAVMRSRSEFVQLFTAFYGFFNCQYNALYMAYMKSKYLPSENHITKWAPFAKSVMYRIVLSSLISSALAFGLGLKGNDDDDKERTVLNEKGEKVKAEVGAEERFLKLWAKNALGQGVGAFYGVRDLAQIGIDMALGGRTSDFKMGSVVTRSTSELYKAFNLAARKGQKDAEIQAQLEKREATHQEKLKKKKGKKRQEYLKQWKEDQQYVKPPERITYPEIAGHAAKGVSSIMAAKTGITSTEVNAITGTMQYMLDKDMRYDPNWKNVLWSAIFNKKPVEREIPKKPEKPKKDKKKKN